MQDVRAAALQWRATGAAAVVVEIRQVQGSAPREAARGCWSRRAGRARHDRRRSPRARGDPRVRARGSQARSRRPCRSSATTRWAPRSASAAAAGDAALHGAGRRSPERWPDVAPLFHLQLHGAGHVGRALVAVLQALPCRVDWIDERADAFEAAWRARGERPGPPQLHTLCVDAPDARSRRSRPARWCWCDPQPRPGRTDLRSGAAARRPGRWSALIGSQTKRRRFEQRWLARATTRDGIARLVCPIGIGGIEGKAPGVIAVAVAAQLLQRAGA